MMRRFLARVLRRMAYAVDPPAPLLQPASGAEIDGVKHDLLMPKYLYTSPLDYDLESHPPKYDPPVFLPGEELPIPPPRCRPGYSPDDDQFYLKWGKDDHDFIIEIIRKHRRIERGLSVLDWGCSSGRVLRHFYTSEHKTLGWHPHGTDIQAYLVEWMRQNFPREIEVLSASTLPHLPYKDDSLDVIYGISVFTHTKYLWDAWLSEFRRVLRPGGLVIQTVQCEYAWRFYHENRHLDWVQAGHPAWMLEQPRMANAYFLYGDAFVSQTFFQEETIKRYWGRIMEVVDFLPPRAGQYQNWIVLRA
jgi:SAM-dependent methyltransferase